MREVFCELGSQILFFCSFNPLPRSFFEKIKLHSGWRSEKKKMKMTRTIETRC